MGADYAGSWQWQCPEFDLRTAAVRLRFSVQSGQRYYTHMYMYIYIYIYT